MALSSCSYCNLCRNLLPANIKNNELGNAFLGASTWSNGFLVPFSCATTPGPTLLAIILASRTFVGRYTNNNLQKAMKLTLKSFVQSEKHA